LQAEAGARSLSCAFTFGGFQSMARPPVFFSILPGRWLEACTGVDSKAARTSHSRKQETPPARLCRLAAYEFEASNLGYPPPKAMEPNRVGKLNPLFNLHLLTAGDDAFLQRLLRHRAQPVLARKLRAGRAHVKCDLVNGSRKSLDDGSSGSEGPRKCRGVQGRPYEQGNSVDSD
jgi:hypothetical protein